MAGAARRRAQARLPSAGFQPPEGSIELEPSDDASRRLDVTGADTLEAAGPAQAAGKQPEDPVSITEELEQREDTPGTPDVPREDILALRGQQACLLDTTL